MRNSKTDVSRVGLMRTSSGTHGDAVEFRAFTVVSPVPVSRPFERPVSSFSYARNTEVGGGGGGGGGAGGGGGRARGARARPRRARGRPPRGRGELVPRSFERRFASCTPARNRHGPNPPPDCGATSLSVRPTVPHGLRRMPRAGRRPGPAISRRPCASFHRSCG